MMHDQKFSYHGTEVTVLGGSGFIGRNVSQTFAKAGYKVTAFGRRIEADSLSFDRSSPFKYISGDIEDTDAVISAIKDSSLVIHLINTTVPGSSMTDIQFDITSNILPNLRWMKHISSTKVRRLIFVSSGGAIYGVTGNEPVSETASTEPINSYGITKLAMEKYFGMLSRMNGIEFLVVRPSNIFGPGQNLKSGQGLIGILIDRAIRGQSIKIWGDGTLVRDYLGLSDFSEALVKLASYQGEHVVFNISRGIGTTVLEVLHCIESAIGPFQNIEFLPARSFDAPFNVLNNHRIVAATGWKPKITLDQGILEMISLIGGNSTLELAPANRYNIANKVPISIEARNNDD